MQRRRASRGDRIVDALDLELGRQVRRDCRRHAFWHSKWPDPFGRTVFVNDLVGCVHRASRWAAGPCNQTGPYVRYRVFGQARVFDRLVHRDKGIGRTRPHEAQGAFVDMFCDIDFYGARDLAAETAFSHFWACFDAGFTRTQRGLYLLGVIPDGRYNSKTGDNDAAHRQFLLVGNRAA